MGRLDQHADRWVTILTVASAAVIFNADMLFPLGVAIPIAYALPVLLTLWSSRPLFTHLAATGATALTLLGFFISPPGLPGLALQNRLIALGTIWCVAGLTLLYKRAKRDIATLQGLLPICASCKKIRDDKGYWEGIEHYIEKHSDVLFTHSICPACIQKWYPELQPELQERHPK
jgi:hypothetical protein